MASISIPNRRYFFGDVVDMEVADTGCVLREFAVAAGRSD
jgi:hypothetical protein